MDLSKEMQDKIIVKIEELKKEKEKYKHNGTLKGVLNRDIELLDKVLSGLVDISEGCKNELESKKNLLLEEMNELESELDLLENEQKEIRLAEEILKETQNEELENQTNRIVERHGFTREDAKEVAEIYINAKNEVAKEFGEDIS